MESLPVAQDFGEIPSDVPRLSQCDGASISEVSVVVPRRRCCVEREPHDVDGGEGQVHVARMYIISEGLLLENCSSTPCLGTDALHQVIDVFGAWAFLPKALDEAVGSCPGESKGLRHLVY